MRAAVSSDEPSLLSLSFLGDALAIRDRASSERHLMMAIFPRGVRI